MENKKQYDPTPPKRNDTKMNPKMNPEMTPKGSQNEHKNEPRSDTKKRHPKNTRNHVANSRIKKIIFH